MRLEFIKPLSKYHLLDKILPLDALLVKFFGQSQFSKSSIVVLALILSLTANCEEFERKPAPKVTFTQEQVEASKKIKYLIVIFQENWSFDSLYGKFPNVNGITQAPKNTFQQIDGKGVPYPNLPICINADTRRPYYVIPSASMPNAPFDLQLYLPMNRKTGDLVHRFYQEINQIHNGKMNAFALHSDAGGFVMSYYDISQTRMGRLSQEYTICDNFFHSCYGGSLLNVLWLFSPQMPVWQNAPKDLIAKVLEDGTIVKDGPVSAEGYLINDAQPYYPPHRASTPQKRRVPPQTYPTIGDRLSAKNISWGWFAEGWDDALNGKPDPSFPFHHQAPSYFKQFAPGTKERKEHLFDLQKFYTMLDEGELPAVSFIRSLDKNSQHPADGSLYEGLEWSADLVERIQKSPLWQDCAIIITYDENGGRWDHVPPPKVDAFGPGTRVPAIIISPYAKRGFVDHTSYETVSILKFIEQRWDLTPLSPRDRDANNLLNAFEF